MLYMPEHQRTNLERNTLVPMDLQLNSILGSSLLYILGTLV